jgi:hypothetical protein
MPIVHKATPRDPVVFVGLMLTMTLLGLIATWGRALNVVVGNARISHNGYIVWKLSAKKTALALQPGVFLWGHILILAHDRAR